MVQLPEIKWQRAPGREYNSIKTQGGLELELSFSTTELREVCESRCAAIVALGLNAAVELDRCLADIKASDTVADLETLFSGDIIERSPDERSLRLTSGHELVFCSGHVETPVSVAGSTDWHRVTRIRVVGLEQGNG